MAARADDFRKQVNDLWSQAVEQLEEVKDALSRSRDRMEGEVFKLRKERDKLLKKLGEQTYKLANQGKLPMPSMVKRTVDRLNEVIDNLVAKSGKSKRRKVKKAGKKKATKRKKKVAKKKSVRKKKTS